MAGAAPGEGRALFSGLLSLGIPDDPMGAFWRAADLVREHRGDSHIAAWIDADLDACEIGVLTDPWRGQPLKSWVRSRGWTEDELDGAIERLTRTRLPRRRGDHAGRLGACASRSSRRPTTWRVVSSPRSAPTPTACSRSSTAGASRSSPPRATRCASAGRTAPAADDRLHDRPPTDVRTPRATRRRPPAAPRRRRPAARRPAAGRRRGRRRAAGRRGRPGRHAVCTAHWKREPGRLRRWLMPTSLTPSRSTSPGPMPAKQTSGHQSEHAMPPRCTSTPATPRSASAEATCQPSHVIDAATSSPTPAACRWAAGTTTSNHTTRPGSSSTAPPPLRRRTTSTPAAAHAVDVGDVVGPLAGPDDERRALDVEHPHLRRRRRRRGPGRGSRRPNRWTSSTANAVTRRWRGTASTPPARASR